MESQSSQADLAENNEEFEPASPSSFSNNTSNNNKSNTEKRKRLCDITYTLVDTFGSYEEATDYVTSLSVWKFERNRPTKKGNKGFFYCRMSDLCKAKVYLLSDPFSARVSFFQNTIGHDHTVLSKNSEELPQPQRKRRRMLVPSANVYSLVPPSNTAGNDEEQHASVDFVNENDYEDSYVDFSDIEPRIG